ncbi:APC family permease [Streptomyces sp. NPDC048636]|uniref:APC family permease n=1 Tax=Streptomyces sp. NPDC048636 TaxID=3155762 RepID=UPI003421FA41
MRPGERRGPPVEERPRPPRAGGYVALAEAATREPHRLRSRSPVHGLDRRRLDPLQVLAQSVSGAAPTAAMAATPAIVASQAGPATLWSFAVATVVALLVGSCVGRFTRRMAAAGSLYSLTAKGLGPTAAFTSGCALLVGYGALTMAALSGSADYLGILLARGGIGTGRSAPVFIAVLLVLAAAATALMVLGIRLAARVMLLTEAASITLMLVIFGTLLARHGPPDGLPGLGPARPDLGATAAGVLPALAAFIGFEAAAALGVEARRPFRTVPRAVQWTAGASGLLLLLAAYAQQLGLDDVPGGLAGQREPVGALATAQRLPWLSVLLEGGIALSFFAAALASATALVRVVFSMGREGIAPRALGAAHPRHRTPHLAIAVALPLMAAVPVALRLAGVDAGRALPVLLKTAAFGYLVAYLLICLAAPVFLHRIGELTLGPVVVTAICAPVLMVVLGAFVTTQSGWALWAIGAVPAAGALWFGWLRLRRPRELAAVGIYDETSAADLLHGPAAPEDRG